MKFQFLCLFILLSFVRTSIFGQYMNPGVLFGTWHVKNWLFFENFKETSDEHAERLKSYRKCLKSKIIIDSNGIKTSEINSCDLDICQIDLTKNTKYLNKKIIPDNDYTIKGQGSEMIDSNIIGKGFVKYLDSNYSKSELQIIDAGCTQSYGNFTMKICIVSKNKIGLFLGEELIILDRD